MNGLIIEQNCFTLIEKHLPNYFKRNDVLSNELRAEKLELKMYPSKKMSNEIFLQSVDNMRLMVETIKSL